MTVGPWHNTYICKKLHEKVFEGFIINARTYIYNIMCSIDSHEKEYSSSCDGGSSGGGCPLPSNSTTKVYVLLSATIDFIVCWKNPKNHCARILYYVPFVYEGIVSENLSSTS